MTRKILIGVAIAALAFAGAAIAQQGKPDQHLKAGDSYMIPAGTVHDAKVPGDKALKVLGVYVVDKTKPLASPAPWIRTIWRQTGWFVLDQGLAYCSRGAPVF